MRPLVGLIEIYNQTMVNQIADITKALFGHELIAADVARARNYAKAVEKYVPSRVPQP